MRHFSLIKKAKTKDVIVSSSKKMALICDDIHKVIVCDVLKKFSMKKILILL